MMLLVWWMIRLMNPGSSKAYLSSSKGMLSIFIANYGEYLIAGLAVFEVLSGRYKMYRKN